MQKGNEPVADVALGWRATVVPPAIEKKCLDPNKRDFFFGAVLLVWSASAPPIDSAGQAIRVEVIRWYGEDGSFLYRVK